MDGQLTVFDIFPDSCPQPELWECMQTCAHCGEDMDFFPGTNDPRCAYGIKRAGTSGDSMRLVEGADRVHFFCKYYKRIHTTL